MGVAEHTISVHHERDTILSTITSLPTLGDLAAMLGGIRSLVGDTFTEVAHFAETTSRELSSFNSMMKPYLDYFYPDPNSNTETFFDEVVEPGRDDMMAAVERAMQVMEGDESIYTSIEESIASTKLLRDGIDGIITIIDEIEIYFLNTMIISMKAGPEGEALTTISREMGNLTKATNDLSVQFKELIGKLDGELDAFKTIRREIAVIQEKRLANMTQGVQTVFSCMTERLQSLSREVNSAMEAGRGIESFSRSMLSRLQMEDLYDQDIDKILTLIDALNARNKDCDDEDKLNEIFANMVLNKIRTIREELNAHTDDFNGIVDLSGEIAGSALSVLRRSVGDDEDSGANIVGIYAQVETMRDEFIDGIDMITEHKRRIILVAETICEIVTSLGEFFADISHINRKLEILNMFTRIELARNSNLAGFFGGSLSEIRKLPELIKRRAAEAETVFRAVKARVDQNLEVYRETIHDQEKNLGDITRSMSRVSLKLLESRKYFKDIMEEIVSSTDAVLGYIGGWAASHTKLETMVESLNRMGPIGKVWNSQATPDSMELLKKLEADLTRNMQDGDYRISLINSFFREFLDEKEPESITFF